MKRIRNNEFDLILASPPCDTFSRVKFANSLGPRPVRDAAHPRGLPDLTSYEQKLVETGSILVDFTLEAAHLQMENVPGMFVLEHPEDLGRVKSGYMANARPASIWQWPALLDLLDDDRCWTAGIRQSDFGTPYVKPTRLLFVNIQSDHPFLYKGKPQFSACWDYEGPIPHQSGLVNLVKRKGENGFRTTGTAAWPPKLCAFLAETCDQQLQRTDMASMGAVGNVDQADPLPPSVSSSTHGDNPLPPSISSSAHGDSKAPGAQPTEQQYHGYWIGGQGTPRLTIALGKIREFHDGAGLTSPGRWPKDRRVFPQEPLLLSIRKDLENLLLETFGQKRLDRLFFEIIAKQEVFEDAFLSAARSKLGEGLKAFCEKPLWIEPGQPFYLNLVQGLARLMNDADVDILETYKDGVPLGILNPLPRQPLVFEEKKSWKLTLDPLDVPSLENENYPSLHGHAQTIREQFEAEQLEGMMLEMTDEEFHHKYGDNIAVSALAALQEADKVRVLLDASHITMVNHRIHCPDQLATPGVREKHTLLREYKELSVHPVSLLGDVSKAHRRYKHKQNETGFLACRLEAGKVWVHLVGTFGVACTAYWWSRLMGIITRVTYGLLGPGNPLDLLIYVDDLEFLASNATERRSVTLAIFYMKLLGLPFKTAKFRGGWEVEWIGLFTNYKTYAMGLSPSRTKWLVDWIDKVKAGNNVTLAEVERGIGRINFAVTALVYEKPFLGILYMWLGAIRKAHRRAYTAPWAVRIVLAWIKRRLLSSQALQPVPELKESQGEWFRSDAKAEDGRAVVGGWECAHNTPPGQARWFALDVDRTWAPWVYAKENDPKRVIASLELLGTILCLILFGDRISANSLGTIAVTGSTDNQGNAYVTQKLLSTKWPLTVLLMELVEQMQQKKIELYLQWLQRDSNVEADALTNDDYSAFDTSKRIMIQGKDIPWAILPQIMAESQLVYEEMVSVKTAPCKRQGPKARKSDDPW